MVAWLAFVIALGAGLDTIRATRLADAASRRDMTAVRTLLAEHVDPNAPGRDGTPALHWAVRADDLDMARLIVRAGADAARADRYGVTPLSLACTNANADMIRLLLDAGANPNASAPTGETALMIAAGAGGLDAVKLLLDRGAALEARDPGFQQTALMMAVRGHQPDGRQRHHAAPDGHHEQPHRCGAVPRGPGCRDQRERLVRPHAALGGGGMSQHGCRQRRAVRERCRPRAGARVDSRPARP